MTGTAGVLASATARSQFDRRPVEVLIQRLHAFLGLIRHGVAAACAPPPSGWSGAGRRSFGAAAEELRSRLGGLASVLESVCLAVAAVLDAGAQLAAETAAARRIVASAGPTVGAPALRQLESALDAFTAVDRQAAGVVYDSLLTRLVGRAERPPGLADPWSRRTSALAHEVGSAPPAPDDPTAVSVWWAGLSAQARHELSVSSRRATGARDGVPAGVRDALNRTLLASELARAQRRAARGGHVLNRVADLLFSALVWPLSSLARDAARVDQQRVLALQRVSDAIRRPGRELLEFDPAGRAVIASGDVDAGRSIAVLVPGMGTRLADVPRMVAEGDRLAAAAGSGAVVVSWLGYDAPGLLQVASAGRAELGAPLLRRFTIGVRAVGRSRQHLVVIGHSYGSLVAGLAARRELPADDLVLLGSPGVKAARAALLRVPAGHVWAVRAPTDPIQAVFWPDRIARWLGLPGTTVFGPDPAAGAFGARHFDAGGAYGHSGYFAPGSRSLANLGRIVSGRQVAQ